MLSCIILHIHTQTDTAQGGGSSHTTPETVPGAGFNVSHCHSCSLEQQQQHNIGPRQTATTQLHFRSSANTSCVLTKIQITRFLDFWGNSALLTGIPKSVLDQSLGIDIVLMRICTVYLYLYLQSLYLESHVISAASPTPNTWSLTSEEYGT